MATYKQPCIRCGTLVDTAERLCPTCGSRSPFGYECPTCDHVIQKDQQVCPGCGRALHVKCPYCAALTFTQDTCEACGRNLMVQCDNKRCGEMQFFQNVTCTDCGHKIKAKLPLQPSKETLR